MHSQLALMSEAWKSSLVTENNAQVRGVSRAQTAPSQDMVCQTMLKFMGYLKLLARIWCVSGRGAILQPLIVL